MSLCKRQDNVVLVGAILELKAKIPAGPKRIKSELLCDLAIDEFESIFRLIRAKWRGYVSKLNLTEIPHSMPTKKKGYLFVINRDTNIITYSYTNPSKIVGDWRDLNLIYQDIQLKSLEDMVKFISDTREIKDENRFWRCDHKLSEDLDSCLLPIISHTLYHKINQN